MDLDTTPRKAKYGETMSFLRAAVSVDTDDCIEWPFARHKFGYGMLHSRGRVRTAHAVMLELCGRESAKGNDEETRHLCNNPPCVNPRHLLVGTPAENARDRADAGTVPFAKVLSDDDVRSIRAAYSEGDITQAALARQHNVDPSVISRLVTRRARRNVA